MRTSRVLERRIVLALVTVLAPVSLPAIYAQDARHVVSLYSHILEIQCGHRDDPRSELCFRNGLRSDVPEFWREGGGDLVYGNLSMAGEMDWFLVGLSRSDRSQIRDLGARGWDELGVVPYLEPLEDPDVGVTFDVSWDAQQLERASHGQVARVKVGHIYVVHVVKRDADYEALVRVEAVRRNKRTRISWRVYDREARP